MMSGIPIWALTLLILLPFSLWYVWGAAIVIPNGIAPSFALPIPILRDGVRRPGYLERCLGACRALVARVQT